MNKYQPEIFVGQETVTMIFGFPNKHCLYVDIKEDKLYFDGERLKTTDIKFNYNKSQLFERNRGFVLL